MTKLLKTIVVLVAVVVAFCVALPAKLDKIKPNAFLARQELSEDIPAQTPYPPAGVRPEVPFNLPNEEKLLAPVNHYLPPLAEAAMFYSAPAEVYGPPAEIYSPPEISGNDEEGKKLSVNSDKQPEGSTNTPKIDSEEETDPSNEPDEKKQADAEGAVDLANEDNSIPERLVVAKQAANKSAKLKKLPIRQKAGPVQRLYSINGNLYVIV